MIRLTIAIGVLAVFGTVGYCLVLLLTNYFNKKNKEEDKQ